MPAPPDLAAEAVRRVDDEATRGLVATRCTAPTSTAWFVGGATTEGSTTELVLVETDGAAASVDVRALVVDRPARPAARAAPSPWPRAGAPAWRSTGSAPTATCWRCGCAPGVAGSAPSCSHTRADGRTPRGAAAVPATSAPARDVVVPGLPAGPGGRAVVVANPGDRDLEVAARAHHCRR